MSSDKTALIEMKNIGVKGPNRWLVRHVDMHISPGEIVTILGPNGSGKTTTLKVLTGIVSPDEGHVTRSSNPSISYVPQSLNIDNTMPLNVNRMMRVGGKFPVGEVEHILEKFDIAHLANQPVQYLSGGEFQRMLLARALLQKPQLLVLDEPAQGVDYTGQTEIYDFIRDYRDEAGAGVLLVSHDLHLVMASTDRVICMNGHICCSGTPQSVSENPHYLELLGPRASDGLAFYRHEHDHVHLSDGRVQHRDGSITTDCHPDDGHHHG